MSQKPKLVFAVFCVSCLIAVNAVFADTIYMQDESIIKGLIVEEHHDRVVFSTADGESPVFRGDIDEIFYDRLEQNYYYIANKLLNEDDFENAEKFYKKAIDANPKYKGAREGLSRLNDRRAREIKKWKTPNSLSALIKQAGVSISEKWDFCRVNKVFAKDTKLRVGDAITFVWDESTKFMKKKEVSGRIAGVPNTQVALTIQRDIKLSSAPIPWYLRVFGRKKEGALALKMGLEGLTAEKPSPGSVAAKAGIKFGDRIVSIDGSPTRYMPLEEAARLIRTKISQGLELTIERDIKLIRSAD